MEPVSIQLIRNATLKVTYGGKVFLIDPMLGEKNSVQSFVVAGEKLNPTVDLPMAIEMVLQDVDAVLLTHSHPDHFDEKAIEVLPKYIPFFNQPADEQMIANAGFVNACVVDDTYQLGDITIVRTTGKHGPESILESLGEVSGFVLQADGYPSFYLIGDCLWDDDIEVTIEKFNPDIIVTNSGGALFRGGTDRILMDVEETIKVAKKAPQAMIVAVHLEALDHCVVTREVINREARKSEVTLLTPIDGQTLALGN